MLAFPKKIRKIFSLNPRWLGIFKRFRAGAGFFILSFVLFFIITGINPWHLIASYEETRTVSFFADSVRPDRLPENHDQGWWNLDQALGVPDLDTGADILSFSDANSMFYQGGEYYVIFSGFLANYNKQEDINPPRKISGQPEIASTSVPDTFGPIDDGINPASGTVDRLTDGASSTASVVESGVDILPAEIVGSCTEPSVIIMDGQAGSSAVVATSVPSASSGDNDGFADSTKPAESDSLFLDKEKSEKDIETTDPIVDGGIGESGDLSKEEDEKEVEIVEVGDGTANVEVSGNPGPGSDLTEDESPASADSYEDPLIITEVLEAKEAEASGVASAMRDGFGEFAAARLNLSLALEFLSNASASSSDKVAVAPLSELAGLSIWYTVDEIDDVDPEKQGHAPQILWQEVYSFFKDISNNIHGAYFSVDLPGVSSWDDLDNLRLKVGGRRDDAMAYIDSVWLDVDYTKKNILFVPEEGSDAEKFKDLDELIAEVDEELIAEEIGGDTLVLGDELIEVKYTDENSGESLIIKADKKDYYGLGEADVYFSITNTSDRREYIDLQVYFPEDRGEMLSLEKLRSDRPEKKYLYRLGETETECVSGWEPYTPAAASTTLPAANRYRCLADLVEAECDELRASSTVCARFNQPIKDGIVFKHRDDWDKMPVSDGELRAKRNIVQNILYKDGQKKPVPEYFQPKQSTDNLGYAIDPGEIQYYRMKIEFPLNSTGEFWIEALGDREGYGLLDPWWNAGWQYKTPIVIDNRDNDDSFEDFQVFVQISASSTGFWNHVDSDGDDVRFVNEDETDELDFYELYFNYASTTATYYVKVDEIPASATTTIYAYYSSIGATHASDAEAAFSYATATPRFVAMGDFNAGGQAAGATFFDDNEFGVGGLSDADWDTGSENPKTIASTYTGDGVAATSTKPIAMTGDLDTGEMWAPVSWQSTEFVTTSHRDDINLYFYNPQTATATVSWARNGSFVSGVELGPGGYNEQVSLTYAINDHWRVTSTEPILLFESGGGTGNNRDNLPVPPPSADIHGIVRNTRLICSENGTSYTIYYSDSTTEPGTCNANDVEVIAKSGLTYGGGPAARVIADKPVAAWSSADGDGYEKQAWYGLEDLDLEYIIPDDYSYLSCSAPYEQTTIEIYNMSGVLQAASGDLGWNGEYPDLWLDNNTRNGGMRVVADKPVYCYYDQTPGSDGSDENNAANIVINRQGAWPRPAVLELKDEVEADNPRLTQNNYRWYANQNTKEATLVIAENMGPISTTNSTVFQNVVTAGSSSFAANEKYLVYVSAGFAGNVSTNKVDYEIRVGSSVYFAGVMEPGGDAMDANQISWFDIVEQGASVEDISLYYKVNDSGQVYALNAQILAISLSDLGSTNWAVGSSTAESVHSASKEVQSSVTPAEADGVKDWLVMAMEEVEINSVSARVEADIYDGAGSYMNFSAEAEDTDEQSAYVIMRVFDDVAQNTTFSLRSGDSSGGANRHLESRIIAINLDIFKNHKSYYASSTTSVSSSDWTALGNLNSGGNYAPDTSGRQVVFANFNNDVGSASAGTDFRLLINSTTSPADWGWNRDLVNNKTSYESDDITINNLSAVYNAGETGVPIDLEAYALSGSGQEVIERSLVVFSTVIDDLEAGSGPATPNNPWPLTGADIDENTAIDDSFELVSPGDVLRLRVSLQGSKTTNLAGSVALKLQYGAGSDCSLLTVWNDVGATGSAAVWRGHDNSSVSDGSVLATTTLGSSDVLGSYEEGNPSASTTNDINVGDDAEWDWVVENNGAAAGTDYCFRVVNKTGIGLYDYTRYPQLRTNNAPGSSLAFTPFDNEKVNSAAPAFTFEADDDDADDLVYQIQWSASVDFTSSTTRSSDSDGGFSSVDNQFDLSPFAASSTIRFTVQAGDELSNGGTYWWRVRARDPNGSNDWGSWSQARSLTVDTGVEVSTWFQTTSVQFETGTLGSYVYTNGSGQVILIPTVGEYGTTTVTGEASTTVELQFNYIDPIVVAVPRYGTGPARTARIIRKASSSFDLMVDDYANSLGSAVTELDWLVMEEGSWTIEDGGSGFKVIAGSHNTSALGGNNGGAAWDASEIESFSPNFDAAPVVLHTVSSYDDTTWIASHVDDGVAYGGEPTVSQLGFVLTYSKTPYTSHGAEDIDFIAFDAGSGSNNGVTFISVKSTDSIQGLNDSPPYTASYGGVFSSAPGVELSGQLGEDGGDGSWSIYYGTRASSSASNYITIVDEANSVTDRQHTTEVVGVVAFESDAPLGIKLDSIDSGIITGPAINYADGVNAAGWDQVFWSDDETYGNILYQVEYYNGSTWNLVPDINIPDNSTGNGDSPIDISSLNVSTYDRLRLKATINYSGGSPAINEWGVKWKEPIRVNGSVYESDRQTPVLTEPLLKLVIGDTVVATTTATSTDGSFSFVYDGYVSQGSTTLVYVDGESSLRSAHYNTYSGGKVMDNYDLYDDHIILRSDNGQIAISDMDDYDNSDDNDIGVEAGGGSLTASSTHALYIAPGARFVPGGSITILSGASAADPGGDLIIASSSSSLDMASYELTVGGDLENAGSFIYSGSQTINMTSSGSTFSINFGTSSCYNLNLSGGGSWLLSTTTTINGDLALDYANLSSSFDINVNGGDASGYGDLSMSGSVLTLSGGGSFGGDGDWTLYDVVLTGFNATTTKSGSGGISLRTLAVDAGHELDAGSSTWSISGSGEPFILNGSFTASTSLFKFVSTSSIDVAAAGYYRLELAPSAATNPVYTIQAGNISTADHFYIGAGGNALSVLTASGTIMDINGDLEIRANAVFTLPATSTLSLGSSFVNNGSFAHNNGSVLFDSTDLNNEVDAGGDDFYNIEFNGSGGWTIISHATSANDWIMSQAESFTADSAVFIEVNGEFNNLLANASTTWTGSTLCLNSTSTNSYTINTKDRGDDYDNLMIGASTHVRMWNSSSSQYIINSGGSLYSMDHDGNDGYLYLWGGYSPAAGTDHWSYATDFDGASLSGSPRQCRVSIASGTAVNFNGATLNMLGAATASTTIANQGSGRYTLSVDGGTLNANYFLVRDIDADGLSLAGQINVVNFDNGDFLLESEGGAMITVASTTIDYNSAEQVSGCVFATSTGIDSGYNVKLVGTSTSYWQFVDYRGNYGGENYDLDYGGICGSLRWDDSYCTDIKLAHYRWRDDDGNESAAGWKQNEDIRHIDQNKEENLRVRFTLDNIGSGAANNDSYTLQIADRGIYDTCTSVPSIAFSDMPVSVSGSPVAVMASSSYFENQATTSAQLTAEGIFTEGVMTEYPSRTAGSVSLNVGEYTELEYNFKFTSYAVNNETYCLRVKQNNSDLSEYAVVAPVKIIGVQVSGNAYEDEAGTAWGGCDGSANNLSLVIGGSLFATSSCAVGTGEFMFTNVDFASGDSVSVFMNTNGGNTDKGFVLTRPSNNYTNINMDVVKNRVVLRTESGLYNVTNTKLDECDSSAPADCANVPFDVSGGNAVFESGVRVMVNYNSTYAPGGNVTLSAGSASSSIGGDLYIDTGSTLDMDSHDLYLGGDFYNYGSYARELTQAIYLTATTSGFRLRSGGSNLANVVMSGGGSWSFADNTTLGGDLSVNSGTLTGTTSLTISGGDCTGNGVIDLSGGTFLLDATGNFGGDSDWTFYNLEIGDGLWAAQTTKIAGNTINIANNLTIQNNQTLAAGTSTWLFTGSGAVFHVNGSLDAQASTFKFISTSATSIWAAPYYNLELAPNGGGSPVYTLLAGDLDAANDFVVGDGVNSVTVRADSNDPDLDIEGDVFIDNNGILTASDSGSFNVAGSWTNSGVFNHNAGTVIFDATTTGKLITAGSSSFYNLTVNNADGGWEVNSNLLVENDLSLSNAADFTATSSYTWYDSDWLYRKKITIDSTQVIANLTDYPLLVSVSDADLAARAQSDGDDIVFSNEDGSQKLAHEIEDYASGSGDLVAWVNIPYLSSSTDTIIYIYYGNSNVGSQQDPESVWEDDYAGVWHLNEAPSGNDDDIFIDATGNLNNGGSRAGIAASSTSIIGNGIYMDGSGYIPIKKYHYDTPNSIDEITACAWITTYDTQSSFIDWDRSQAWSLGVNFGGMADNPGEISWSTTAETAGTHDQSSTFTVNDGDWHYICATFDSSQTYDKKIYIDGDLDIQTDAHGVGDNLFETEAGETPRYGFIGDGSEADSYDGSRNNQNFSGTIDEVRILESALSAGRIKTEYNNHNDPSTFASFDSQETYDSSPDTVIEVNGVFTNNLEASDTIWSKATLYLNGTDQTLNTKTAGSDEYYSLKISSTTRVKMWNSSSTKYLVQPGGSLYSMDHQARDGYLYIWGDYKRNSGTEYWSRARDFDGSDLSSTPRQCRVRLSRDASVMISTSSLEMKGSFSARTSLDIQGGGHYSLTLSSSTIDALYYEIKNTDAGGLRLLNSTVITSLDQGAYELDYSGGTSVGLDSSTLNTNSGLDTAGCVFNFDSNVSSGYNIKLDTAATGYIVFSDHSGNMDGESYDSDPGDPRGYIIWSDSPDYTPKSQDWRWYYDEEYETPVSPAAATNTAPSIVGNNNTLKLRMSIAETAGLAGEDVKMRLQYSTQSDFSSNVYWVGEQGSSTALWTYGNGIDADNEALTASLLADSSNLATHNESGISPSSYDHALSTAVEWEFTLYNNGAATNTVYYIRAYADYFSVYDTFTKAVVTNSGEAYPSLYVSGGTLSIVFSGLSAGTTTEGVVTNINTNDQSVDFGELTPGVDSVGAQRFAVTTDAEHGYQMFAYQKQDLLSNGGADIDPVSGTNESPAAWPAGPDPSAFGYHTGDDTLSGASPSRFAPDDTYARFETNMKEIFYSPIQVEDENIDIVYRIEANQMQEAGDYSTQIVYILTPTY